jgi:hypothetical protein
MKIQMGLAAVLVLGISHDAGAKGKEAVTLTPEEMKWVDVPDSGGVQIAPVKGDPMKGAYDAFAKFPAGNDHPLHTHTNEVEVIVISGTFNYAPEGGTTKGYGPGSYLKIPGGMKHTSGCAAGAACVIFQEGSAKFDYKPVAAPKK